MGNCGDFKGGNKNMNKTLKITVGIPTCYGGESLVETVKSLRASSFKDNFEILIEADRTPLTPDVKKALNDLKVKWYWNDVEGSQCKKLNQIIKKAIGDIFIFTQDDIIFDKNTLDEIHKAFSADSKLTMTGIKVLPLKPLTFFESLMGVMLRTVDKVAYSWNKGDNYLTASGRCLAFRTSHLRKFRISNKLINTDTFMYFENTYFKGKYKALKNARVFIRPPQSIKDQLGPSSRYQYSKLELSAYFKKDLSNYYKIPKNILLVSALREFLGNPLNFSGYTLIYIYTRLRKFSKEKALRTIWTVDKSTKIGVKG